MFDFSNGFNFDGIKPTTSPSKLSGSDGVAAPGGYLYSGERNPKMQGEQKWVTFANAIRKTMVVAAAYRAYDTVARSVKWRAVPNKAGGRKAKKMADIAQDGLIDAQMPTSFPDVAGKSGVGKKFMGFSMHEWSGRHRDTPGRPWVFSNLEHRPQHTIHQWLKPNEREPWTGVIQRTKTGGVYPIARAKVLYQYDDTITDQPDGAGFLSHVIEMADKLTILDKLEGRGFQSNIAGIPVAGAPLAELSQQGRVDLNLGSGALTDEQLARLTAYVRMQIKFLTDLVQTPEKLADTGAILDTAPYLAKGNGDVTPSAMKKWTLEILKGTDLNLEELAKAINRVGTWLARLMHVEHIFMGDGEGARAVADVKVDLFLLAANSMNTQTGRAATIQLAWPMTALNNYDPETCTPSIEPQPIPMETITSITEALKNIAAARGPLPPTWEGTNVILERANLPPIPEDDMEADARLKPVGGDDPNIDPTKPRASGKQPDKAKTDDVKDAPGTGAKTKEGA